MRKTAALLVLASCSGVLLARTRTGAVRVAVGEPSVWSLEQAHYLLERLRNKNGRLESAPFTNLDPNAVDGSRFEAIRRVFGISAEFDQSVGAKNKALSGQYETNLAMRKELESRWLALVDEQVKIEASIRVARVELARMDTRTTTEADRKMKADEIAALEKSKGEIDARIATMQQAMGSLGVTPEFQQAGVGGPLPGLPDSMDPSVIKAALKRASEREPKLDASAALDNHIQFNYELISKQLTLLRDEAGPARRILFLELPQTVYGVPGKGDDHLGQSWWRVAGIVTGRLSDTDDVHKRLPGALRSEVWKGARTGNLAQNHEEGYRGWKYLRYEDYPLLRAKDKDKDKNKDKDKDEDNEPRVNPPVRSVELIPRVNGLNVAQTHSAVRRSAISVIGRFLWGFGAQLNYSKQRETYDQFMQQEVYASGHGKGTSEFGWIFGPTPGSKSVSPGVRTTYAVIVVPDDAAYLKLLGRGCQYHRKTPPPAVYPDPTLFGIGTRNEDVECGVETAFHVQVPPADQGFSIWEIDYLPVRSGERVTMILRGADISPQIGVLVDGVPLTKVLSLGSPNAWRDEFAENSASIRGQMEYLSSSELAFSFSMPPDYVGTPQITLVTPSKAYTLNRLKFKKISGCPSATRDDCPPGWTAGSEYLRVFAEQPGWQMFQPRLIVSKVDAVAYDASSGNIGLLVLGRDLDLRTVWRLNGEPSCKPVDVTAVTARLDCVRPVAYTWQVTAIGHDPKSPEETTSSLSDPFPPAIGAYEVVEPKKAVKEAKIKFKGNFFNSAQIWELVKGGEMTAVELKSLKEVVISVTKASSTLKFQVKGSAEGFLEQHTVTIQDKDWK